MKRRALAGALMGLLSASFACAFEAPSGEPFPDAETREDLGAPDGTGALDGHTSDGETSDGRIADAEPMDSSDAGAGPELGPADLGPLDAGQAAVAVATAPARVCPGEVVALDGSASTGDALVFLWSQLEGPSVTLEDADTAMARFEAPDGGALRFQLSVSNDRGTSVDTTTITVEATPSVELGPERRVRAGEPVAISVTSTLALGGDRFEWTQRAGPSVTLVGADTATVSFTAPPPGEVVDLELGLTNRCGAVGRDTVSVRSNHPPSAATTLPSGGLPHDTVQLDATGSADPDQDPLAFEWSLLSAPPGHVGGFEPFPGAANLGHTSPTPAFYPTVPGTYALGLSVSDGLDVDSTTLTFQIAAFELLPYANDAARLDTRALAVRASDGHVFLGTSSGAQELRLASTDVVPLTCLGTNPVTVVRAAPDGRVYFGFDGQRRIAELAAGGGCVAQTHDPGSVLNPNPTSTRDIFVTAAGDLYVATDADVAFFSRTSTAFTREVFFTALGGANSDFSAVAQDGSGYFWFGSREPGVQADGAVRVLDPLSAPVATPRIDFLGGSDDLHAFVTGLVAPPAFNEFWVLSRSRGVLQLEDADDPSRFRQYTILNGGLPPALLQDELTRGVYDAATQDVWIAMRSGVARYKRDVGAFVAVPLAVLGVSGRVYDLVLDQGTTRGRSLYVAAQTGTVRAISPP